MGDVLLRLYRSELPPELLQLVEDELSAVEAGDYRRVFQHPDVQILLGQHDNEDTRNIAFEDSPTWGDYIRGRLHALVPDSTNTANASERDNLGRRLHLYFLAAVAALYAFVQSNVTGPPLPFSAADALLPQNIAPKRDAVREVRAALVGALGADGIAAYKLTPNVELICLASSILSHPLVQGSIQVSVWTRLRTTFVIQRLLSEPAPTLQKSIYEDLQALEGYLLSVSTSHGQPSSGEARSHFLLERAAIHTHHGLDKKARADLDEAAKVRKFDFALTGMLGKRTKFQQTDLSQLVVLARSADAGANGADAKSMAKPENLDLNDDTLLESISFSKEFASTDVQGSSSLPASLTALDPAQQPLLDPIDSTILLSLASSITNTNPADGLMREETVPYATRVLEGGSSNWQIYTQALLVRSRIEGYRSRTMERGLLQLQALVDQVIAETSGATAHPSEEATSFLPRAKESESASVTERLRHVFSLCTPLRWELEAELAARWVSVGGLRSALEIYERLEMWAEAALCWAATEKEDKARRMIRRQLFHATHGKDEDADTEHEAWNGLPREPAPGEAPRLYCILGDLDNDLSMYERAWETSGKQYGRAQRSLGQRYFAQKAYEKAADAYSASLKINPLNQTAWFALGCAYLELQRFMDAASTFSRCVQLDDEDAESWSNLAASLLHLRPKTADALEYADHDPEIRVTSHPRTDALKAFKRAAALKHDSYRIWSNVLAVAASTSPPAWQDVVSAQRRICEMRGSTDGEKCVDAEILDLAVRHVVQQQSENGSKDALSTGLPRMVNELVENHVKPLITFSPSLWITLSTLYTHTNRPSSALECHEKAWRAVTAQPNWENKTEKEWNSVARQTLDLVDAYETLGPRERTEGLAAGTGELVAKDWKFKARSAVRSVMGKGKEAWEGTGGWEGLVDRLGQLKGRE